MLLVLRRLEKFVTTRKQKTFKNFSEIHSHVHDLPKINRTVNDPAIMNKKSTSSAKSRTENNCRNTLRQSDCSNNQFKHVSGSA